MKSLPGTAVFSACGQYRYLLTRQLNEETGNRRGRIATFIMLNPSTADATRNDPTIRRCIGFARRWQCDTLQVLNIFAVRATLPSEMKRAADPVGPENLQWFARALTADGALTVEGNVDLTPNMPDTHLVVCAWGVHGAHRDQDRATLCWLYEQGITPLALGITRHGQPRHPLYAPYTATLIPYDLHNG